MVGKTGTRYDFRYTCLNAQMLSYDGPYLPTVSRYATPTEIDWVKADTPARKLGTNREARMLCTWSTSMIRTDGGAPRLSSVHPSLPY